MVGLRDRRWRANSRWPGVPSQLPAGEATQRGWFQQSTFRVQHGAKLTSTCIPIYIISPLAPWCNFDFFDCLLGCILLSGGFLPSRTCGARSLLFLTTGPRTGTLLAFLDPDPDPFPAGSTKPKANPRQS